ncbi:MAG: ABC transporter permease [Alicyclobacillus sp.]|nr:ABC transporter permease [Alicyclobacillus sp.]
MLSIVRKELKLLLKGKGNFFFLILMPMIFICLFGSVFSSVGKSTVKVNYVDLDHTATSQQFVHAIGQVKGFALRAQPSSNLTSDIQQVADGKLDSLLVIPSGFGTTLRAGEKPAELRFYVDPTAASVTGPIESVVNEIANQYQTKRVAAALAATGAGPAKVQRILQPSVQVQEIQRIGNQPSSFNMVDQVVPGYTVMFAFFILMSMMRSFIGEKESGMLTRLLSTPLRPLAYLVGMWIPSLIAVLVQCVVLLGFGHAVYGVHLGDLGAMAAVVLCLGICGTGIGLAISLLVRGENQGRSISMLISIGGAAVGGLWLPTQLMPHAVQVIGRVTPQYWAQQAFQNVMMRSAHIGDIWQSLAILLAFGAAGLLVAVWRFPHFVRSATH